MSKFIDLTNQKFNRLTVISQAKSIKGRIAWLCQCDCGNIKVIRAENLRDKTTKSCGCLNIDINIDRGYNMGISNSKYHPRETTARRVWKKRYNDGISFDDFLHISQMNCHYCGAIPNNEQNAALEDKKSSQFAKDNGTFIYNGLDRIDSSLPHIMNNIVPCCKWCNYAKRERSVAEFEIWIEQVYQAIQKRKGS